MSTHEQDRQRREQAVADFLATKCASVKCPACGKSGWQARRLSALVELTEDPYPVGGVGHIASQLPACALPKDMVLPVQCACGYLMLFSAEAIGAEPRAR